MSYLLDTNVISELVAKRPNPQVVEWVDSHDPNSLYLSVVTLGEIRKGIEKLLPSKRRDMLSEWLSSDLLVRFQGRILVLDVGVMLLWGELTGRLERAKRQLPAIDSLIGALALYHSYQLVTRNEDDFKETGVSIVNPWR
ncbi:MAG: type II toxin-antitoxin system VapC family toxin [Ktedonobacteraceae bacterium]|nr:type II toxin-antitoxin system VapC family toxin [Ktedonobacteraceae bacterium]